MPEQVQESIERDRQKQGGEEKFKQFMERGKTSLKQYTIGTRNHLTFIKLIERKYGKIESDKDRNAKGKKLTDELVKKAKIEPADLFGK